MSQSVSVIIPTFNRASVLSRALDSVLGKNSKGLDIELIVIDDGSTDMTKEIVTEQYPNVLYNYQKNQGVSAARNRGLQLATKEWIALLDSDDEWLPGKLAKQFELLNQTNLEICHTEEIWIRNGVRVNQMNKHAKAGGWIFNNCLPLCAMSPSSILMHKSVFDSVGGFNEKLPACEDYDLWLRIASQYEVAFVETPLINKYGGHEDQLSRQYWGMDRFRVIALESILKSDLKSQDYDAALKMLIQKLKILLIGARKHNNIELIADCEEKLNYWQDDYN